MADKMANENAIPTIDVSPLRNGSAADKRDVARQIDAACIDTGFFIVAGHGVPQTLIESTRQTAIDFFALPVEEKMKVQRPPAKISRGYNWLGDRSVAYSMGQVAPPDIQEEILFLPASQAGRDAITLRHLQPIARVPCWTKQRRLWHQLKRQWVRNAPAQRQ